MSHPEDFNQEHLIDAFLLEPAAPEPSAKHLEQLRSAVLSQTEHIKIQEVPTVAFSLTNGRKWRWIWYGSSVVAAVTVLIVFSSIWWPPADGPIQNFRQALAITAAKPWIHGTTTITTGGDHHTIETWFSPTERLAAMRSEQEIHHTDYNSGVQTSYNLGTGTFRQSLANPHGEQFGRALVVALLSDGDLSAAMPFHQISQVNKLLVADGHTSLTQYQFYVSWQSNPTVGWLATVLVDQQSNYILSWEERHSNGTIVSTRFDYPNHGPRDIQDLGAPAMPLQ